MDTSWIAGGNSKHERCQNAFTQGLNSFLNFAFRNVNEVKCPCVRCENKFFHDRETIRCHVIMWGFISDYTEWVYHGEKQNHTSNLFVNKCTDDIEGLLNDACEYHMDMGPNTFGSDTEVPPQDDDKFEEILKEASIPLYPGCDDFSKLSFVVHLFRHKCINKLSNKAMSDYVELLGVVLPKGNKVPKNWYECKKLMSSLGLDYQVIHACPNDCILFWREYAHLDICPKCSTSRWIDSYRGRKNEIKKRKPQKVLRYFPLTPRLKRLFRSMKTAPLMLWHSTTPSGKHDEMSHPRDSKTWMDFDKNYPTFSNEPRNVRLALATDGFSPFNIAMGSSRSIWPVILICYNLPPWLAMHQSFFMMSLLIDGPKSPGNKIDVYLQPLIDELKMLWDKGVITYDANANEVFNMRAMLLWTIGDFPAYGMLSGWSTKGYKACPYCHVDHGSIYLPYSHKCVYLRHRRFLPVTHPWRDDKRSFNGKVEKDLAPQPLDGNTIQEMWEKHENLIFENMRNSILHSQQELPEGWKKRSIFFYLPYWSTLLVRHNLDVMHVEKNISENILGWLLHKDGKSKDNIKARLDMQHLKIRRSLWPKFSKRQKTRELPHPIYSLTTEEKENFLSVLKEIKLPEGFSVNFSRLVHIEERKLVGMKSHDHHILLEHLLPVAAMKAFAKPVRKAVTEFCIFFKELCARVITIMKMEELEQKIPLILCKLERIFPPAFFDVMVHLAVHLATEAKLAGPVQFRWMYPIERYLFTLKNYIRNRSKPEGSIAEGYLMEEATIFCERYLHDVESKLNRPSRYEDGPLGASSLVTLTAEEFHQAERFILLNTNEVQPYVKKHKDILRCQHPEWDDFTLQMHHRKTFVRWFKDHVASLKNIARLPKTIQYLSHGPKICVYSYKGYYVNGYKFECKDVEINRVTQNSGIATFGLDDEVYYGVLERVIEIHYVNMKPLYLFKCSWFSLDDEGTFIDDLNITSIDTSRRSFSDEPFIYPEQAQQVFYSRDPQDGNWSVVCHWQPRNVYKEYVHIVEQEDEHLTRNFQPSIDSELVNNHDVTWTRSDIPRAIQVPESLFKEVRHPKKRKRG